MSSLTIYILNRVRKIEVFFSNYVRAFGVACLYTGETLCVGHASALAEPWKLNMLTTYFSSNAVIR